MKRNVGQVDRVLRALGAVVMAVSAAVAPVPLELRVPLFGALAAYFAFTALSGTCLGYTLLGTGTCPRESRS